jgi:hypothetical protein
LKIKEIVKCEFTVGTNQEGHRIALKTPTQETQGRGAIWKKLWGGRNVGCG